MNTTTLSLKSLNTEKLFHSKVAPLKKKGRKREWRKEGKRGFVLGGSSLHGMDNVGRDSRIPSFKPMPWLKPFKREWKLRNK